MAPPSLPWSHSAYATPSSAVPVPSYPEHPSTDWSDPEPHDPRERRERLRSGPQDIRLPWFLPFFDEQQTLSENAAMRLAYRRMLADPNVKAALYGKILAVAGYDLKVVPADRKSERDAKLADLVRWNLTEAVRDGFPGLVWSVFSGGLMDGYSVCEKVWGRHESGRFKGAYYLRALKPKDVGRDLVLVTDEFRNVTAVRGLRFNPGVDFPPSTFVIYRHQPLFDLPTGQSDLRAVYSRWWLLDTALKLRAVGIDKRALPLVVGHYKHAQDRPALEEALALVKSQNWLAVPETVRLEALSLAGSGDGILADAVRSLAEDIFLGIAGATLQARQGDVNNARGSSAEHRNTADLFIRYLAQRLESLLNDRQEGLIKELCDLNAEGVEDYPTAVLQAPDDKDLQARVEMLKTAWEMGLQFSRQALYDELGIEPPDPQDAGDVLGSKADQEAQVAAATLEAPGGPAGQAAADRVLVDGVDTNAQQEQQQAAGVTGAVDPAAMTQQQQAPPEQPPQLPAPARMDEQGEHASAPDAPAGHSDPVAAAAASAGLNDAALAAYRRVLRAWQGMAGG